MKFIFINKTYNNDFICLCHRVAENGDLDSLAQFISCGITPRESSVVLAAYMGRAEFVRYLLDELGLPVDSVDSDHRTALHRACQGAHIQVVK